MNTAVDLAGLRLRNPVMPASGCFGFGREYAEFYPLSCLGAVVTKAITGSGRRGNPTPRVTETDGGMLNSIGLANPGVDAVLCDELPWLRQQGVPIIANAAGSTVDEYCEVVDKLSRSGLVDAVELNVSCPNVETGGLSFGVDPDILCQLVTAVRPLCTVPLIVKLSPNTTDITAAAGAAAAAGADALSLINTLVGMAIDVKTRRPILARGVGGYSGPGIKPVALRMVYQTVKSVNIPVIGMGGIRTGIDAIEFIMAGAAAVSVGTANFTQPDACVVIVREIEEFMRQEGIGCLEEIRGCAL